jgi:pimeloyl-ACP methyl ester carboxylesterase
MATRHSHTGTPSPVHSAFELRALLELAVLPYSLPWLMTAPKGDGHPVLLLPGFMGSETSLIGLEVFLRSRGHSVETWGLGRNVGFQARHAAALEQKIRHLHHKSGRKVSLVGWSLGGLYARELAKRVPEAVRCVVTLGSPFAGPRRANNAWRTYAWLHRHRPETPGDEYEDLLRPPPVPTTSIFSRSDGVVAWQCSVEEAGPMSESIEVRASHLGLGVNPLALYALADRLAQPEGAWRPFDRSGARRLLYPDPQRSR